jgi:hypothetical protein
MVLSSPNLFAIRCDLLLENSENQLAIKNQHFWKTKFDFFQKAPNLEDLNIDYKDPNWIDLQFPNNPDITAYANLYVKNITLSLSVFADYFESSKFENFTTFINILRQQNKLAIVGKNSTEPYGGFFLDSDWKAGVDVLLNMAHKIGEEPGATRDELIELERQSLEDQAGILRTFGISIDLIDLLRNSFGNEPINKIETSIKINNIPKKAFPKNNIGKPGMGIIHEYPNPKYLTTYLNQMFVYLKKIRGCTNCSRLEIIGHLVDYYYTGINAHLFSRVNQSLLMTQVNYILRRIGINGVKHSSLPPFSMKLDIAAITMSHEDFRVFLINEIINQNDPD